jgi:hypothetical protein
MSDSTRPQKSSGMPSGQGISLEPGASLYWFNSEQISDAGNRFYGAYVYEHLLLEFSPGRLGGGRDYGFCDGDYLPPGQVTVPFCGKAEEKVLASALELGSLAYIVAVYGFQGSPFAEVDRRLKSSDMAGYIGMTSYPDASSDQFIMLTEKLGLPFAFKLEGSLFRRSDFAFMNDEKLRAIGFDPAR